AREQRGEVVAAGGGPGDDQLHPQVQDVRVGAEVLEIGAGEGEPHQGGAERAARGDGEVEGEHTRVLEGGHELGGRRLGRDGHGVLLVVVGRGRRGGAVPSARQHHRAAGGGVGRDVGVQGEGLVGHPLGDDRGRGALGVDLAGADGGQVIGVAGGEVEVVQHDADGGAALAVEVADHVEHLELVGHVEVGGGL